MKEFPLHSQKFLNHLKLNYMFENYIETQRLELSKQINTAKRFVPLSDILINPEINAAYKSYLNAEVEWWIYEEQIQRRTNINFDFENEKLKSILDKLDEQMFLAARFDKPGIKTIIDSAIQTRLNFLLRPRTALKWFVFRGEPTKPFHEIIKRMNYLIDYDYLLSGFINYINENRFIRNFDDIFSVIEFERIVESVDNDYIFALSPEQFLELLFPINSFFNPEDEKSGKFKIPVEALIIFLDDKGIEPLVNLLKDMLINDNTEFISSDDFLNIIYKLLNDSETEQKHENILPVEKEELMHENIGEPDTGESDYEELNDKLKGIGELSDLLNTTFSKIHSFRNQSTEPDSFETEKEFNDFHDGEVIADYSDMDNEITTDGINMESIIIKEEDTK